MNEMCGICEMPLEENECECCAECLKDPPKDEVLLLEVSIPAVVRWTTYAELFQDGRVKVKLRRIKQ